MTTKIKVVEVIALDAAVANKKKREADSLFYFFEMKNKKVYKGGKNENYTL